MNNLHPEQEIMNISNIELIKFLNQEDPSLNNKIDFFIEHLFEECPIEKTDGIEKFIQKEAISVFGEYVGSLIELINYFYEVGNFSMNEPLFNVNNYFNCYLIKTDIELQNKTRREFLEDIELTIELTKNNFDSKDLDSKKNISDTLKKAGFYAKGVIVDAIKFAKKKIDDSSKEKQWSNIAERYPQTENILKKAVEVYNSMIFCSRYLCKAAFLIPNEDYFSEKDSNSFMPEPYFDDSIKNEVFKTEKEYSDFIDNWFNIKISSNEASIALCSLIIDCYVSYSCIKRDHNKLRANIAELKSQNREYEEIRDKLKTKEEDRFF